MGLFDKKRRGTKSVQSRALKKLRRRQKGSTAIEFAIVSPIFIALMLSIVEIGWVGFSQTVTIDAITDVGRLVRTGQIQNISITDDPNAQRNAVFEVVCRYAKIYGNCSENVTVEVQAFKSFAELEEASSEPIICQNSAQDAVDNLGFNPGGDSSIVRVRVCILYETLNPAIGLSLRKTNGQPNRLISQLLFHNEPFERNTVGGNA